MPFPAPIKPGWYWAKLIHPTRMPEGEDWNSVDWEVVHVDRNSSGPLCEADVEAGEQEFSVLVTGIQPAQWVPDFVWGSEVPKFDPRSKTAKVPA